MSQSSVRRSQFKGSSILDGRKPRQSLEDIDGGVGTTRTLRRRRLADDDQVAKLGQTPRTYQLQVLKQVLSKRQGRSTLVWSRQVHPDASMNYERRTRGCPLCIAPPKALFPRGPVARRSCAVLRKRPVICTHWLVPVEMS